MMVVACTYACSLAMGMPISTPPNALAYATGFVKGGDMGKAGILVGVVGLLLSFLLLGILRQISFF